MGPTVLWVGATDDEVAPDRPSEYDATVERADSAEEALAILGDADCVVVDAAADGDGLDVLDAVGADAAVPVLFTSAEPDGELAAAATRRGATEYVPRTTDGPSVADRVQAVIDDGHHSRRQATLDRYEDTLQAVDDGVYALDDEGQFAFVNEAFCDLTGYDRDELLGEHTSLIKDAETVETAEAKLRELLRGADVETTFDLEIRPKTGDPIPCEDHMTLRTDDGEFVGTAGVVRDVTARKRREERLSSLLASARSLIEADSREAVASIVAEAIEDILGLDIVVVRLYDAESGTLPPTASAAEDDEALADRPVYAVGEGGPGRAFETGDVLRAPGDLGDAVVDPPEAAVESVYLPLGDHGTVSLAATDADGLDETAVSLAEILASNAAVALDRAAREAELERYRTVLENVQDMVYVLDEDERFALVTEPLADWLGYDRADLVGASPERVFDASETAAFQEAIADLWYHDGHDESRTLETELVTADGERRPAEVEVSLIPPADGFAGTVGVVRDRTELVRTRQLLEDERDRFSYLFDNLPDAVVETTFDERDRPIVRAVNESFTDVFGLDAETVRGESLNDFVLPPNRREEGRELDRMAAAGEPHQVEVRRRTADGYRDFLFRGIPYDTDGDRSRGFGIYTDISEQKRRERKLEVLNRVLRHNLRNDLNVVLGYADMLAEEADGDLADQAVALREKAVELTTLAERARRLERAVGSETRDEGGVDLASLVADAVDRFRDEHPAVAVETDVESATVAGDARLELALSELLENAVEHCVDPTVRVETVREGDHVELRVADDGPGIPATERDVITGRAQITQLRHGSGLGLWVAKWVCESCGGHLRFAESDLGGSAVVLSLSRRE